MKLHEPSAARPLQRITKWRGEIEALNSASERHDHQLLAGHVASWKKAHPAAGVEVIAEPANSLTVA